MRRFRAHHIDTHTHKHNGRHEGAPAAPVTAMATPVLYGMVATNMSFLLADSISISFLRRGGTGGGTTKDQTRRTDGQERNGFDI